MGSFLRKHPVAVLLSVALHGALAAILTLGIDFGARPRVAIPVSQVALQATVVDEALIAREMERLEQQEQAEVLRRQEEERQALQRAEAARREREEEERRLDAARREREEAARAEEARVAELQRQRDEEARRRQEEAERQRIEEEARQARVREEQERRQREEEERRRQEAAAAAQRAEAEAQLRAALALEDERRRAEQAGLLDQYILLIENRIEQNWIPPVSARAGLECVVNVTQIPSGDVIDVRVGRCNGDEAVVRSIEAAVLRASPLPKPPIPSLFERNLVVVFNPEV